MVQSLPPKKKKKITDIKYPTIPACPALYLQNRHKKYLYCIFKLKQNTFAAGVNQMRL